MKTAVLVGVLALGVTGAQAESLTEFFAKSNLVPLAHDTMVYDLEAQSVSKTPQDDVDVFDDFFLINAKGKLVVNFDHALKSKGDVKIPGWVGVSRYSNHTIKSDLQEGWKAVKEARSLQTGVSHVVVYKTLNAQTPQFVYDYAVEISQGSQTCQEYLYLPETKAVEDGMRTACYWTLEGFKTEGLGSAGKLK